MLEIDWDPDDIFQLFKEAFKLENDDSKDFEIWKVINMASRYVTPVAERDPAVQAELRRQREETNMVMTRLRGTIQRDMPWPEAEIIEAGMVSDWTPEEQSHTFLATMFQPDDTVWLGNVWDSGINKRTKEKFTNRFRTVTEWRKLLPAYEFTSHCTFKAGSFSRSDESLAERRYMVVESDELSRDEIGAVFRWLMGRDLRLRAVVYSGKRSLHGWFDYPGDADIRELKAILHGLQCDPSTLRASQPVRFAGRKRKDTGNIQKLLYLTT
jgi:hypothetical protein